LGVLVGVANEKFDANAARVAALFDALRAAHARAGVADGGGLDAADEGADEVARPVRVRGACRACGGRGHREAACPSATAAAPFSRRPQQQAAAVFCAEASRAEVLAATQELLLARIAAAESAFADATAAAASAAAPAAAVPTAAAAAPAAAALPVVAAAGPLRRALLAPRRCAPSYKNALKARGWLDASRKGGPHDAADAGGAIALPLADAAPADDAALLAALSECANADADADAGGGARVVRLALPVAAQAAPQAARRAGGAAAAAPSAAVPSASASASAAAAAEAALLAAPGARWACLRAAPGCGASGVLAAPLIRIGTTGTNSAAFGCPTERVRIATAAAARPGETVYDLCAGAGCYLVAALYGSGGAPHAVRGVERDAAAVAAGRAALRLSANAAAAGGAATLEAALSRGMLVHGDGRVRGALPAGGADRVLAPADDDEWCAKAPASETAPAAMHFLFRFFFVFYSHRFACVVSATARRIAAAVSALRRGRGGALHLRLRGVGADADVDALSDALLARVRAAAAAAGARWAVRAGALGSVRLSTPSDTLVVDIICEGAPENTPFAPPVRPPAAPLRRVHCPDAATFEAHVARTPSHPFILTGAPFGACVSKWSAPYLASSVASPGAAPVSVHVAEGRTIDLAGHRPPGTRRNFCFRSVPFSEAVRRCAGDTGGADGGEALPPLLAPGERLYLRSVGGAFCLVR
jgi:hypothetical protein